MNSSNFLNDYTSSEEELTLLTLAAAAAQVVLITEREKREIEEDNRYYRSKKLKTQNGSSAIVEKPKIVDTKAFRNLVRMDAKTFDALVQTVEKDLQKHDNNFGKSVSARESLGATLLYLSTGKSFENLEIQMRLPHSYLAVAIPRVCDILYENLKGTHMKFPSSHAELENIAAEFHSRMGFPLCIGALGRKQIAFRDQKDDVLLALVDANCRFLYVHVDDHGRVSDGGALRRSNLMHVIEHAVQNISSGKTIGNGRILPYVIVADDEFPFQKHIMKPYPCKWLDHTKNIFNARLSRARNTVEHTFRILASRFFVLQNRMDLDSAKIKSIVRACCILHNFLLDIKHSEIIGVTSSSITNVISEPLTCATENEHFNEINNNRQTAIQIRDEFANYFNNEGVMS